VAFSSDGKRIVSGSDDKTLRLWDATTGQPIGPPLQGHTESVTSVAFSPDGRRIVSGSDDNTLRLWDLDTPN
jgi:WD40 repeat protein